MCFRSRGTSLGEAMAGRRVRGVVCALALLTGGGIGDSAAGANARALVPFRAQISPAPRGPEITGQSDGRHARMTAAHKGLVVTKTSTRADRSLTLEIRYRQDLVSVALDKDAVATVTRGGRALRVDSPEALERLQQVLSGSEAIFAFRALLAEREAISDLQAPEYTLLASAAFVASLVGDTDAPRRLASRFVEKHRGIVRPVRAGGGSCWGEYSGESTNAWNDLQQCMNEANQDSSFFYGAYRRLACNGVWMLRSESAWFEYLECLNPLVISG